MSTSALPSRRGLLTAALALPPLALATSGCALLSSPDPVRLYRFGQSAGPGAAATATPRVTLQYAGASFPRAAGTDRLLTTSGAEVSYVGDARWAAPAAALFEEAVMRAFQGGPVRLLRRGASGRADGVLRMEVRTFEARYASPEAAPTVVIEARVILTPVASGMTDLLETAISVQRPAAANRVSAIAEAFDAATADLLGQVLAWTAATAQPRTA